MDVSKNEDIAPVKWSKKRKIGFWASVIFVLCCTIGAILPPILTQSSKTTQSTTATTRSTTTTSKTTISTSKTTTTMQTSQSTKKPTTTSKEDTTTMVFTEESDTTAANFPRRKFGHICKDYDGDGCDGRYMTSYDGYLCADHDALLRNATVVQLDNDLFKFGIVDPENESMNYATRPQWYEDGDYIAMNTDDLGGMSTWKIVYHQDGISFYIFDLEEKYGLFDPAEDEMARLKLYSNFGNYARWVFVELSD